MKMSIEKQISKYLVFCKEQKLLSKNSLRAYRIDFYQFIEFMRAHHLETRSASDIQKEDLRIYIKELLLKYSTRTCKRKIACIKAFFNYLEYEDIIGVNPFRKIKVKFKEPQRLPKTMTSNEVESILCSLYAKKTETSATCEEYDAKRKVACIELLFSTGMRVGELCNLRVDSIDLDTSMVRIIGKGNKERMIYIASHEAVLALKRYEEIRNELHPNAAFYFTSNNGHRYCEDSVRKMIHQIGVKILHKRITPHMFRHTFASLLLNNNVDIKVIQELLGHSSITTTQIYIHLTTGKLKTVLQTCHPRCFMHIQECSA